jgi:hypothetical protein
MKKYKWIPYNVIAKFWNKHPITGASGWTSVKIFCSHDSNYRTYQRLFEKHGFELIREERDEKYLPLGDLIMTKKD